MSLINDALRRASNASKVSPPVGTPPPMALPPPPLPPPPRAPAQYASPPPPPIASPRDLPPAPELDVDEAPKSNKLQLILSLLLVVCVLAAAAFNYWQKNHATPAKAMSEAGKKPIIADANVRLSNSNAVASALAQTRSNPAPAAASPAAPSMAAPVAVAAPAAPVVPVKFPTLRLQSIFYRTENPSVIINNKTLFVNDEIQGVSVADIRASSVTLVLSGQTNILTLR